MTNVVPWEEIAARLALTIVAGAAIGFDRESQNRPAGLRTTLLVTLAAAVAMIYANLLFDFGGRGKAADSYLVLDPMRFPLGILSGVGFIGAGAILRKENMILGVTTAATLWFATVMGLCFGGGQIYLGLVALGLGLGVLRGFKWLEHRWSYNKSAVLMVTIAGEGPNPQELAALLEGNDCRVGNWSVVISKEKRRSELSCEVRCRADAAKTQWPAFLIKISQREEIVGLSWDWIEEGGKAGARREA